LWQQSLVLAATEVTLTFDRRGTRVSFRIKRESPDLLSGSGFIGSMGIPAAMC